MSSSQVFGPYLNRLRLRPSQAVAGLHITSEHITLVALRDRPLRLVAIGRSPIDGAAVVDDQIRLVKKVGADLQRLAERLRLKPDTPTIAAVEPLANSLTLWDDGPGVLTYGVAESTFERIGRVLDSADLLLTRIDIVPAALARLGRQVGVEVIAGRAPNGWSVVAEHGFTDAERSDYGMPSAPPLDRLDGIAIPARLRNVVDPAGDAAAIGAALAGFGVAPIVPTEPAQEVTGPDWTVQYMEPTRPGSEPKPPGAAPPDHNLGDNHNHQDH